jgi:hypothetical protein
MSDVEPGSASSARRLLPNGASVQGGGIDVNQGFLRQIGRTLQKVAIIDPYQTSPRQLR